MLTMLNKTWFNAQLKTNFPLETEVKNLKAYTLNESKQVVFEYTLNANLGENSVDIAQVTDLHFNFATFEEIESDEEIRDTVKNRVWLKNGEALPQALFAMEGAKYSDLTVVTGDILDYLSKGAIYLTKNYLFDRYINAMYISGGHELTKQMQTGKPDKLSIEERTKILTDFWLGDFFYQARNVGEKVIAVGLNNGYGRYFDFQADKLEKEIENARKNGKIILIFQHEPIATGNENDKQVNCFYKAYGNASVANFYDNKNMLCSVNRLNGIDERIYRLITLNADVIKGVFVGHYHSGYYTEINASYNDNGKVYNSVIPQICAPGNPYFDYGSFVKIIIK